MLTYLAKRLIARNFKSHFGKLGLSCDRVIRGIRIVRELESLESALDILNAHLRKFPSDSSALLARADTFLILGEYEKAVEDLNAAEQNGADHWLTLYLRSAACLQLGDTKNALDYADRLVEKNPHCIESWITHANAVSGNGDSDTACQEFEHASSYGQLDANSLHTWAYCLVETKRYQKAIDCLTKSLQIDSKRAYSWDLRAKAHYHLGNFRTAHDDIERAVQLAPENSSLKITRDRIAQKLEDQ